MNDCNTGVLVNEPLCPQALTLPFGAMGVSTAPVATPAPPKYDNEVLLLCAPNGDKIRVTHVYDETNATGVPNTTVAYNLTTASAYAGALNLLVACPDVDAESDGEDWCAGGINYTKFYVKSNGQPTGVVYWVNNVTNAIVAPPTGATKGKCEVIAPIGRIVTGTVRVTDNPLGDGSTEVSSGWDLTQIYNGGETLISYSWVHIPDGEFGSSVEFLSDPPNPSVVVYSKDYHTNISAGSDRGGKLDEYVSPKVVFKTVGRASFQVTYAYRVI